MGLFLLELLQTTAALFAAAFLVGLMFDRTAPGLNRQVGLGLVCGLAATFLITVSSSTLGSVWLTMTPLFIAAGLFGGVVGALVAVTPALAFSVALPSPEAIVIGAIFVVAGLVGAGVRAFTDRWQHLLNLWPDKLHIGVGAMLAPIAIAAFAIPGAQLGEDGTPAMVLALFIWLPAATATFALLVNGEEKRSAAAGRQRHELQFERSTGHVSRVFFQNQISHHYHLSNRYGATFTYLTILVDDQAERRASYGAAQANAVTEELACAIRASVRDSDVCAVISADCFAVLLPHTAIGSVAPVVDRIQRLSAENVAWAEGVAATVSVGAADSVDRTVPGDVEAAAEAALLAALQTQAHGAVGPEDLMTYEHAGPVLTANSSNDDVPSRTGLQVVPDAQTHDAA